MVWRRTGGEEAERVWIQELSRVLEVLLCEVCCILVVHFDLMA